jgi:hypothetical protein
MPSPFPGMDPYLEGDLWTSFHALIAAEIARQLAPLLRPNYIALPQRRNVLDRPDDLEICTEGKYPDVAVVATGSRRAKRAGPSVLQAPVQMPTIIPEPVPHNWVEIRDVKNRKLVTAIEFLSPTNKHGLGRQDYMKKREKLLKSTAHLMEIDLLRKGLRPPMRGAFPKGDYFVFLCRTNKRPITDIWPISVKEPLPTVPVPLLRRDPDVFLDLQEAFSNVYDAYCLDLAIDYSSPPDIPLARELGPWAKVRLRAAYIRSRTQGSGE